MKNVAPILIDYQNELFERMRSETSVEEIELNARMLIRAANAFGVPVLLSTVGVETGANGPTRPAILTELRTSKRSIELR